MTAITVVGYGLAISAETVNRGHTAYALFLQRPVTLDFGSQHSCWFCVVGFSAANVEVHAVAAVLQHSC